MPRFITCGLAALAMLVTAGSAVATTLYRWVDAQGVVHYSDTPQPGAQAVDVHSAQTYRAPPAPKGTTASQPAAAPAASTSYQCSIVSPSPEQSFYSPETVAISVSVNPALAGGDQVLVYVDGTALPSSSGQGYQLSQPERGPHTVSAMVRGADGKTACTAAPVTFDVQKPSLLSPSSPARGH
jgi:hypothetical protein